MNRRSALRLLFTGVIVSGEIRLILWQGLMTVSSYLRAVVIVVILLSLSLSLSCVGERVRSLNV